MTTILWTLLAAPASACTWWWWVGGFEPELTGATGVPTDALVVTRINGMSIRFEVVPQAGGAAVPGVHEWVDTALTEEDRIAFRPDAPLAPDTTYDVDVYIEGYSQYDPLVPVASTWFTTGAGPAPAPIAPTVGSATADGWAEDAEGRWYCTIGNPVVFRTVAIEVDLPESPPWSWVVVRDTDRREVIQHLELSPGAGAHTITFFEVENRPGDCFTVAIRTPDGEEAPSAEICVPPDPFDSGDTGAPGGDGAAGCGCSGSPAVAAWGLGLLPLLGLRRRRSTG